MIPTIDQLRARGVLSPLDQHFSLAMASVSGEDRPEVLLAVALASQRVSEGDVCLDLRALVAADPPWSAQGAPESDSPAREQPPPGWPGLEAWLEALGTSRLVTSSREDAFRPLVLDDRGRLYLRRYWVAERRLAAAIDARAAAPESEPGDPDAAALRAAIARLFPAVSEADGGASEEPDWPRIAAAAAVRRRLAVICGGPGTGKTTTAAGLLALLVERALRAGRPAPRIGLLAPTGKAAARLAESIGAVRGRLDCDEAVRDAIPTAAETIHRALGAGRGLRFRRNADNPLRADVVLVDEASMVDLALMAQLLDAIPAEAHLVLLGDRDQLASVEAGSVLGDLCAGASAPGYSAIAAKWLEERSGERVPTAAGPVAPLRDCIVTLTRTHRHAGGIAALAGAINRGDAAAALQILEDERHPDVQRAEDTALPGGEIEREAIAGYRPFALAADPEEKLAALDGFRVLCALRRGARGVEAANRAIESSLVREGLLEAPPPGRRGEAPGRPVLVTRNAPHVELWNGDIGVLAATPAPGDELRAVFAGPRRDGASTGSRTRSISLSRMPPHELVFAMTVHKSQGSEFDDVVLVLPDRDTPILTRELIFTAVTRARRRVVVHGAREVIAAAIERPIRRASGLRDALWGAG